MAPKIQFERSGFRRRTVMVLGGALAVLAAIVALIVILASGGEEPTEGALASASATAAEGASVSPTASPSPPPSPEGPPTVTPTPTATATLEPYQYVVQPGETLYYIIQLFGYRDLQVVPEILALNNLASENDIKADQVLLIPRQTPTPGPTPSPGPTATETPTPGPGTPTFDPNATPDYTGCSLENRCISPDGQFWIHEVVEGDTPAGLAFGYYTTVQDILRDNNLSEASFIRPGQILQIRIKVTLTPTLTPTGGPDSTATPTPVFSPPTLLAPANGATIAPSQTAALQWAPTRPLPDGAYYLVQVRNLDTGDTFRATTTSNVYRLPDELKPGPGQSIDYGWTVVIVEGSAPDSLVISEQGSEWVFTWGS